MIIKYRLYITVGLIALMCLIGCGRSDAPVVLTPLEEAAQPEGAQDAEKTGVTATSADPAKTDSGAGKTGAKTDATDLDAAKANPCVTVHVCGAVREPGVYKLPGDARVADALLAAGDFAANADTEYLNLAAYLTDGEQVYVPTEEEVAEGIVPGNSLSPAGGTGIRQAAGAESEGLININTATLSQLKTLPGIGDVKANAIIAYREANGGFTDVSQIQQVEGIKEGLYRQICDKICVR